MEIGNSLGQINKTEEQEDSARVLHYYNVENEAYKFAVRELEVLCKMYPTRDNPPIIMDFIPEILALVSKFGRSGQSGGSQPFVAGAIVKALEKILSFKPILPITGFDEEWTDIREVGNGSDLTKYQNKRLSSVFKDVNNKAWYLDAIVWKNQRGTTWTGSAKIGEEVLSQRQYIKSFPFEPKTFVIDVIETELSPDDFIFNVKYNSQLNEVFEYYDKMML